jgi:hypothetical protein
VALRTVAVVVTGANSSTAGRLTARPRAFSQVTRPRTNCTLSHGGASHYNPRSEFQHKPGVVRGFASGTPRKASLKIFEPRRSGTSRIIMVHVCKSETAVARCAGSIIVGDSILGLTPQALCFRPLRGLCGLDIASGVRRDTRKLEMLKSEPC